MNAQWSNNSSAPNHGTSSQMQFPAGYGYVSQEILQNAMRMNVPVGTVPNDDALLAQALSDFRAAGMDNKQAIESLNGVNNHAAILWKDYYLQHTPRIEALVQVISRPKAPVMTIKKPTFDFPKPTCSVQKAPKRKTPPASVHRQRARLSANSKANEAHSKSREQIQKSETRPKDRKSRDNSLDPIIPQGTKRRTMNSMFTGPPTYTADLPPPNAEIKTPEPPSRSPTPPTEAIPLAKGYKYTEKDKEFFLNFICWRKSRQPELTRLELCTMLEEKVPHHTARSWQAHWQTQHDVADKIFLRYSGGSPESDEDDEPLQAEASTPYKKPDYRESPPSNGSRNSASYKNRAYNTDDFSSETGSEVSSWSSTGEDEEVMGGPGEPYSRGEMRAIVKHIALTENWHNLVSNKRWIGLPEPEGKDPRTHKSRTEYFRINKKSILKKVRRYKEYLRGEREDSDSHDSDQPNRKRPNGKRAKLD